MRKEESYWYKPRNFTSDVWTRAVSLKSSHHLQAMRVGAFIDYGTEHSMGITFDEHGPQAMIGLNGVVDISSAAELKTMLMRSLNSSKEVCVSLDGSTALDVTAVQLLWAAQHEAIKAGTGLTFIGPVQAEISTALCEAGLQQFLVTDSQVNLNAE